MKKGNSGINRTDRLSAEFQKEIYQVISQKLKNPEISGIISVLKVDVSSDLKHAKVFISVFATTAEKTEQTFRAIASESKRIRYELSQAMRIRTVPELQFVLDDSMAYSDKISKLLNSVEKGEQ